MKHIREFGRRFLALLLSVAIIVSQVPFGAVATEESPDSETTTSNVQFKIVMDREVASIDEETGKVHYNYSVYSQSSTDEGATWNDVSVGMMWERSDNGTSEGTIVGFMAPPYKYNGTDDPAITFAGTYKGLRVAVSAVAPETTPVLGEVASYEAIWTAESSWSNATIIAGDTYTSAEPNVTCGELSGAVWELTGGKAFENAEKSVMGTAGEIGQETTVAVYELKYNDETIYTVTDKAKVEYASVTNVAFSTSGAGWYSEDQIVTITAESGLNYNADMLKPVTVDVNDAIVSGWVLDDNKDNSLVKHWTNTATLMQTGTITAGKSSVTVQIDKDTPVVSAEAYRLDGNTVFVEYQTTVGTSGLKSINVYGADNNELTMTEHGNQHFKIETANSEISISVTNNAGVTSEVVRVPVNDSLRVSIDQVSGTVLETKETTKVLDKDEEHKIALEITGASNIKGHALYLDTQNISVTDSTGASVGVDAGAWAYDNGKYTAEVVVTSNLNGLKVTATDSSTAHRTASAEDTWNYVFDRTAPAINVGVSSDPTTTVDNTKYYKEDSLVYTLTVTDDLLTNGTYSVNYKINGESKDPIEGRYSSGVSIELFKLNDGEVLTELEIVAADDDENKAKYSDTTTVIVDNTAPVVDVVVSSNNVTQFFVKDGAYYAYINPAVTDANAADGSATLELTFTLIEANPDNDALITAGWQKNDDNVWTKTINQTVSLNQTGVLKIDVAAADMVGLKPVNDMVLSTGESAANGYVYTMVIPAVDGAYRAELNIDRRMPSTGPADQPPAIELTTDTEYVLIGENNNIHLFSGNAQYRLLVNDNSVDGYDSGVDFANVTCNISENDFVKAELTGGDGDYIILLTAEEGYEANDLVLTIVVPDKVGNTYTFQHTFAVDTKAPEITVNYTPEKTETYGPDGKVAYYNGTRTAEVIITDLHLNSSLADIFVTVGGLAAAPTMVEVDAEKTDATKATYNVTFEDNNGGDHVEYTLAVSSGDKAGNKNAVDACSPFRVYKEESGVELTVTSSGSFVENNYNGTVTRYYNDKVTVTAELTDKEHVKGTGKATLTYKLDTNEEPVIVAFTDGKAEFTIGAEQVLTAMSVEVVNDAGTATTKMAGDTWLVGEDMSADVVIAVDMKAPQVTIDRVAQEGTGFIQAKDGVDYFNGKLTYTITIRDKFLALSDKDVEDLYILVNGEKKETVPTLNADADKDDEIQFTFEVTDEIVLETIEIPVKDIVGRLAEVEAINNMVSGAGMFTFGQNSDECIKYTGNKNIVDTVRPIIEAEIVAVGVEDAKVIYTVDKFFTRDGVYFAYISPAEHSSNLLNWFQKTEADSVKVDLTFTLTEINPDVEYLCEQGWVMADNKLTYSVTETVKKEQNKLMEFAVPVLDMAAWKPDADVFIESSGESKDKEYPTAITLTPVDGVYTGSLFIDRDTPVIKYDSEIELNPSINPSAVVDGKDLFNGSFDFQLSITDANSGINSVEWTLEGDAVGSYIAQTENKDNAVSEEEIYLIPVRIEEVSETAEVKLTVTVKDNVNNVFTYIKTFCVDNKNPQVIVEKNNLEEAKLIQTITYEDTAVDYYNGKVQYTVKVSDLFLKEGNLTYVVDGEKKIVEMTRTTDENGVISSEGTFVVDSNQTLSDITFWYIDEANHYAIAQEVSVTDEDNRTAFDTNNKDATCVSMSSNDVVVDMDDPEVQVTVTCDDKEPIYGEEAVYYNSPVTYTVEVTDEFLTNMASTDAYTRAELTYTKENQESVKIMLPAADNGWIVKDNTYSYSFTVEEGEVLTGIELLVYDNSGNAIAVAPDNFEIKGDVVTYIGDTVIVDNINPEILVNKDVVGKFVQDFDGTDYYNGKVTYTVTVTDASLTNDTKTGSKAMVYVTNLDGSEMDPIDLLKEGKQQTSYSAQDQYSASFEVADGEAVKNITIIVIDNAGNISTHENVTVQDDAARTSFETKDDAIVFSGLPFVVDEVKPEASLKIEGNVSRFYTNKDGVLFVQMNTVSDSESGTVVTPADYQTIKLVLTIQDKNLTLEKNAHTIVSNHSHSSDEWESSIQINQDSSITYVKSIRVKTDDVGVITMDMDVFDLAGNPLTIENITYEAVKGSIVANDSEHILFSEDGKFTTSVSVDRRRPSSVDDNNAPTIQITPADSSIKTTGGIDLYNGAFSFGLTITDGAAGEDNSGINYVNWVLEDRGANPIVVNVVENTDNVPNDVHQAKFTIPVSLIGNGQGESNDVFLTITAVDNVGNKTTFEKRFAVDNLAPRVQVAYDNNDVRNDKYFKANRRATITMTDINLDPNAYAVINSTGAESGWIYDGKVGSNTYSFTVEGEHHFDLNTSDLAGNHTPDADVQYIGEATHDFILDKTLPVIGVTFSPSSAAGKDENGVNYYDQEQNITVTVRDQYFDSRVANSVSANMGANNSLGAFYQSGTVHTATTKYVEGNNYSFNITVTDLAGNVSATYSSETFSVDLTAPTITVSKGTMTSKEMNIVSGDLVLGFTINDAQQNLRDYKVTVTHTNNAFKEEIVEESVGYYGVNDLGDNTTVYVDFANIAATKDNDGIYNVKITAEDYAGHIVSLSPDLNFSLNRFGSTFVTGDDATAAFLAPSEDGFVYKNVVENPLVIKEINPNKVYQDTSMEEDGSVITIAVNGNSIILEKNVDFGFAMEEEGQGSNKWYVYTYTIYPDNFMEGEELVDGNYSVLIYGVDEAGNNNTNVSNEYSDVQNNTGKIEFTLDHKEPVITAVGVEKNETVDAEYVRVTIGYTDSTSSSVKVYVDDTEIPVYESMENLVNSQMWVYLDAETGSYILNLPESSSRMTVKVVTTDAAGNTSERVIEGILVNTNWFIRAINSPVIVGGFVATVVAAIGFFIIAKKKKKEKQPA